MDQMLAMIYAQLTGRTSLRQTTLCLGALGTQRYHCGFRGPVAKSSLADANESRDYRIFRDTALCMIATARRELPRDPELAALQSDVYLLDSTIVTLCLKSFPWAKAYRGKGGVKLQTLLDLHSQMPVFIAVSDARWHDMYALDNLPFQRGAYYVFDRAYSDFARLYRLHQAGSLFVTRAKRGLNVRVQKRQKVVPDGPVIFDHLVRLRVFRSRKRYPDTLRRIGYLDPETGKKLVFLTNDQTLPAEFVALLYRKRWQIELFFKWIKQHLRIKRFFGRSQNAVATQVWIAVIVFVLVHRFRQHHNLRQSPREILCIFSAMILDKTPIMEVFCESETQFPHGRDHKQLPLF